MPSTVRMLGLMITHSTFYDLLMTVHTLFMYPWVIESFSGHLEPDITSQITAQRSASSHLVANAARSLIIIARSLDIDRAGTQS